MVAIRISYEICELHQVVLMVTEISSLVTTIHKTIVFLINVRDIFLRQIHDIYLQRHL